MKNKMDFITHFWIRNKFVTLTQYLLVMLALFVMQMNSALAEGINHMRYQAKILSSGQLSISSRFQIELPEQLQNVLKQGVALDFALSYRLERPTIASYRFKLTQLLGTENSVNYRLTYHPLTGRYRVSVGTFSTEYNSLEMALRAVGAIVNWRVLNQGALLGTNPSDVKAQVRLSLSSARLPKPFQINALTSNGWDFDSGWRDLDIGP